MRARGDYGLSKWNYGVISFIYLLITLRLIIYITINVITVKLIIEFAKSHEKPEEQPVLWILFRGIIGPIIYVTELIMVCYMVYHQDRRNMKEKREIRQSVKKKKETKTERQKEEFFLHLGMNGESTERNTEREQMQENVKSAQNLFASNK